MVDVVGWHDGRTKPQTANPARYFVDPSSTNSRLRIAPGQLGKIIEPDFAKIIKAVHGTESYAWSKKTVAPGTKKAEAPATPPTPVKPQVDPNQAPKPTNPAAAQPYIEKSPRSSTGGEITLEHLPDSSCTATGSKALKEYLLSVTARASSTSPDSSFHGQSGLPRSISVRF